MRRTDKARHGALRRRAPWISTAVAAVLGAGALLFTNATSQAAVADNPGALKPLTTSAELSKLALTERTVADSTIAELDRLLPNVGVDTVLGSANHTMPTPTSSPACRASEQAALPVKPKATAAYCFTTGDALTQSWLPQSVTSSGDADDDGAWGENKVILSGWTHNDHLYDEYPGAEPAADRGLARVAFIDANTPGAFKYRWVLLTVPTEGGANFAKLGSHLGGMVWYGDKLIVTASNGDASQNALYVFSMKHILQATVNSTAIGKVSGGYSAHGYQYLMPAIGSYGLSGKCSSANDDGVPCFGSISLDRSATPDRLVANEWFSSGGTQPARLFRYDLAAPGGAMPLAVDGTGKAKAADAYETKAVGVQGVLSYQDDAGGKRWYVPSARGGPGQHGILWRQDTAKASATSCSGTDLAGACWAKHSESMSLWWSTRTVWSVTEWAADSKGNWQDPTSSGWQDRVVPERVLFSVPLSSLD
ncbi:hypothetical protein [Streptomyces sp. NPDC097640]|uniref:hypothetical protein n=1 Tax=Streptomyces sp. NPDC097640 TaxID=3157229 RepID=UPI00332F787F